MKNFNNCEQCASENQSQGTTAIANQCQEIVGWSRLDVDVVQVRVEDIQVDEFLAQLRQRQISSLVLRMLRHIIEEML